MMVADFSAGRPGVPALRTAGFDAAIRYAGFADRLKCFDRAELLEYMLHNFPMAVVFQDGRNDWHGGFGAGRRNGLIARSYATDNGFPTNRPIYMAIDSDVVTAADFNRVHEYLHGAQLPVGVGLLGVYGEYDVIQAAWRDNIATWYWQTSAWSHSKQHPQAHLYQTGAARFAGPVMCDVNEAVKDDWGQTLMTSPRTDQIIADFNEGMSNWDPNAVPERRNARTWAGEVRLSLANIEQATAQINGKVERIFNGQNALDDTVHAISERTNITSTQIEVLVNAVNSLAAKLDRIATPEGQQQIIREAFAAELPNLHIRGV